jgi:hypothetical protein
MKRGRKTQLALPLIKKPRRTATVEVKKQDIPALFSHWREFLLKDSFTDLKVVCRDDCGSGGVSLHRAVLASCSSFMASILSEDGRDKTSLFLPDVTKEDFTSLVRNLYGETTSAHPSNELLHLLGIDKLPARLDLECKFQRIFFFSYNQKYKMHLLNFQVPLWIQKRLLLQ